MTDETDGEAFARLEKKYGQRTYMLGPMSRKAWLMYWREMERTEPKPQESTEKQP